MNLEPMKRGLVVAPNRSRLHGRVLCARLHRRVRSPQGFSTAISLCRGGLEWSLGAHGWFLGTCGMSHVQIRSFSERSPRVLPSVRGGASVRRLPFGTVSGHRTGNRTIRSLGRRRHECLAIAAKRAPWDSSMDSLLKSGHGSSQCAPLVGRRNEKIGSRENDERSREGGSVDRDGIAGSEPESGDVRRDALPGPVRHRRARVSSPRCSSKP